MVHISAVGLVKVPSRAHMDSVHGFGQPHDTLQQLIPACVGIHCFVELLLMQDGLAKLRKAREDL